MNEQPTVIDTPEGIRHYRLCAQLAALRLQLRTGLRHSKVNVLAAVKKEYGLKGNLVRVIEQLDAKRHEQVRLAECQMMLPRTT